MKRIRMLKSEYGKVTPDGDVRAFVVEQEFDVGDDIPLAVAQKWIELGIAEALPVPKQGRNTHTEG